MVLLNFVVFSRCCFTLCPLSWRTFLHVGDYFVDSVVHVISLPLSFSLVEFIPRTWKPTEFVIVCRKFFHHFIRSFQVTFHLLFRYFRDVVHLFVRSCNNVDHFPPEVFRVFAEPRRLAFTQFLQLPSLYVPFSLRCFQHFSLFIPLIILKRDFNHCSCVIIAFFCFSLSFNTFPWLGIKCLSFHYFHYSYCTLSSVAFDADCLSADCSHVHWDSQREP